jgi:hypothetical protein
MIGTNKRRICRALCVVFACVSLLHSQSLVESAKKERERRDALKARGITSVVVTNADLKRQKRLQIVAVQSQNTPSQGISQPRQRTPSLPPSPTSSQQEINKQNLARNVYGYRKNATKVIFLTGPVKNPDLALSRPDDQFAVISEMGVLDLEFNAKNGSGADIAVYARMATQREAVSRESQEEGMPIRSLDAAPQEGFWYGVLVMDGRDEWQEIGRGSGMNSPEEFDLGEIAEVKQIRIMFKPHNNPGISAKLNRITDVDNTVNIDAVEALH